MLLTVEGIYSDGKVELTETPTGVLLVTFLSQVKPPESARYLSYGQFAGERMVHRGGLCDCGVAWRD